jgi:hypothetical protein
MPHPQHAPRRFPRNGKRFGQKLVQRGAVAQTGAEFLGFCGKGSIIQSLDLRFKRVDFLYAALENLEFPLIGSTKQGADDARKHEHLSGTEPPYE